MQSSGYRPWIVALAFLEACTYIGTSAFEEKRNTVDEDRDRSPWSEDCDDEDPDRSPAFDEIPYDGIDNDCGLDGDAVDLDGDGFPGISEEAYDALSPAEPFPEALRGKPLDCADDPSARPEASTIHPPPNDGEIPYDGLDSDCDRSNDFDVDGDGWIPDQVVIGGATIAVEQAFSDYVSSWGYQDAVAGWAPDGAEAPRVGDCNDFAGEIHPDPPVPEIWYDGIDQDCDGANDFDQDGDGFMPPGERGENPALYERFVDAYHQGEPPWTLPSDVTLPDGTVRGAFDDCLDQVDPQIDVDPAAVFPRPDRQGDLWYDGIDSDCGADNDFDQDGDAFFPAAAEQAYLAYRDAWGYADREGAWGAPNGLDAPRPGDCDDDDPETYPEALERIGDGSDQDCDGNPDAARFAFADWTWDRPSAPRAARIGDTYLMAVTARSAVIGGAPLEELGLALAVPLAEARTGAVPAAIQFKGADPTRPVDPVVDLARIPNDADLSGDGLPDPAAWLGTTFTAEVNGYTYLFGRRLYENSSSGTISVSASVSNYSLTGYTPGSFEIVVDLLGEPWLMSCTSTLLHAIQGIAAAPTEPELEDGTSGRGGLCFATSDPYALGPDEAVDFTRCDDSGCQQFSLLRSSVLAATPGPDTGESWIGAEAHGDLQILIDGRSLIARDPAAGTDYRLFDGRGVSSGDAARIGNRLFGAAIVDDGEGPRVELTYGTYPLMVPLPLEFSGPAGLDPVPTAVALQVDADRVLVVVTARDRLGDPDRDTVGWMFLGTP